MTKYIKKNITIFLILCVTLLSGCQVQSNRESVNSELQNEVQADQVTFEKSGLRTYIDIYEKKLFYMEIDGTTSDFYVYNFESGKNKKISTISNFALKGKSNTFVGDTLYFYISTYDGTELENILYAMDFSTEKMRPVSKNSYSKKLIPLITLDNKLYSLQGKVSEEGTLTTFVEELGSKGTTEQISLGVGNVPRQMVSIDSDDECLYAIEKDRKDSHLNCYLTKYNQDFSFTGEVNITDLFEDYEIMDQIGSFFVFHDFVCLTDYSNNTIIFERKEDDIDVLLCENDMEYIVNNSTDSPYEYFYKRNTNDIYKFNTQSAEIQIQNYDLKNNSSTIRVVLSNQNDLLIVKTSEIADDSTENIYLIPKRYDTE
ncbi:hypothetical protein [Clostridium sp. E02]|uniref:hypothetical protein n=1 Tax=Clostridium sp. E02 TaxID=2487134 RepID=UPI000F524FC4|nr:hypothetical protein [Clostridium sp. E02]